MCTEVGSDPRAYLFCCPRCAKTKKRINAYTLALGGPLTRAGRGKEVAASR